MPTTNYIWDEENLLAETDGSNVVQTVYTNEPQQYGNLVSTRLPIAGTPTTVYHHYDAIGSTRQLTNSAGSVTDTMIYDTWGNLVNRTGTTGLLLLWVAESGYYFDSETNLVYVRARLYEPAIGRWTSIDPLRHRSAPHAVALLRSSSNYFVYAANSSCHLVDPTGLWPAKCQGSPKGVTYVGGRGWFTSAQIDPIIRSDLESRVAIGWSPFTDDSFLQRGCCCCDRVGFVQIVRTEFISTNLLANQVRNDNWVVDGFPLVYPVGTEGKPCTQFSAVPALFTDRPQVPIWVPIFNTAYWAEQEFETCAVCVRGNEGIVAESFPAAGSSDQNVFWNLRVSGLSVYGCIRWQHTLDVTSGARTLVMDSKLLTSANPLFMNGLRVETYKGLPPSDRFISMVTEILPMLGGRAPDVPD